MIKVLGKYTPTPHKQRAYKRIPTQRASRPKLYMSDAFVYWLAVVTSGATNFSPLSDVKTRSARCICGQQEHETLSTKHCIGPASQVGFDRKTEEPVTRDIFKRPTKTCDVTFAAVTCASLM